MKMRLTILAVDTSTRWAGVALNHPNGEIFGKNWHSDQNHSVELMPNIRALAEEADLKLSELSGVAVATGPGGFTAVRVGISAAIGLAMPGNLPIAPLPTHCIEAQPYLDDVSEEKPLYSLLPAGRGTVSWAKFVTNNVTVLPEDSGLSVPSELAAILKPGCRVCGEGGYALKDFSDAPRLSPDPPTRSFKALIRVAQSVFEEGQVSVEPPAPNYARPPNITKSKSPQYGVR